MAAADCGRNRLKMLQDFSYALSQVIPQAVATGLFSSLCTILQPDGNLGASGAPSGVFVAVAGLSAIPCMDAVPREGWIKADERRSMTQIQSGGFRHVALNGYYYDLLFPLIQGGLQAAITDAQGVTTTYNLLGCEPDSQAISQTRLSLEVIAV